MAPLGNVSVVSAAIIEGSLILGLSDGSIINCGYVQGPQGLKGDPGPTGATGEPGRDGNTIHTVAGTPRNDMGQDGDYAIDNINWRIYGPKSAGVWGNANDMLPSKDNLIVNGRGFEGGVGGSGDTGGGGGGTGGIKSITAGPGITVTPQANPQIVEIANQVLNSRTLPLVSPSIPDGLETQEDYNLFVYDALSNLGQGEGGIETFPWIRIYMFKSEPSTNWFYQTSWETNTNADYTWQWEVDASDTGNFIDIADHPQKTELGFDGREFNNGLFLNKIGQESTFPNAKIRQRITSQINSSPVNELSTPVMQMWQTFEDVIDEPLYSKGESGGGSGNITFATKEDVEVVQSEVDELSNKTDLLPYRIETDKVLREGKAVRSSTAEIQLVDNDNNFTNVKFTGLNGIEVTSDQQGIRFDGAALLGDITVELDDYATKAYSDAEDQKLQNQIDDLQVQKGAAANYDCKNNSSNPYNARAGEIAFNEELSSAVTVLGIGADDKSGRPTKSIQQGDIIEVVGPDGSDTRYKVTDPTAAPTYILVNYIAGEQGFALDVQYTVYIYPQNEAGASKEYVDAQDALLFPKAGGTLTGTLAFRRGEKPNNQFKISPNGTTDYNTNIYGLNNGVVRLRTSHTNNESDHVGSHIILSPNGGTPTTAIYNLIPPTQDEMAATKKYVDDHNVVRPAQLTWRWEGDKGSTTTAPSAGSFLRSSSSNTDYLRLSFETSNGVDLGDSLFSDTNVSFSDGPVGCIWYYDAPNRKWRLKMQFRCGSWRWNYNAGGGPHFEFGFSSRHGKNWSNFTIGTSYYITVGGFF